jgi:hypothetical protein
MSRVSLLRGRKTVPEEHDTERVFDCAAGLDATRCRYLVDRRAEQEIQQNEQRLSLGFDDGRFQKQIGGTPIVPSGHPGSPGTGAELAKGVTLPTNANGATSTAIVVLDTGAARTTSAEMRLRNISGNLQIGCRMNIEGPRDAAWINFD